MVWQAFIPAWNKMKIQKKCKWLTLMFRLQCITSLVQLLIPHYNILTLTILKSFGLTNRQTTQISCIKITAYRSFLVDWETERAIYDFIPRYPIISFSFLTRMLQQKDFSMSIRLDWKSGGAKRSGSNDESKYLILITMTSCHQLSFSKWALLKYFRSWLNLLFFCQN